MSDESVWMLVSAGMLVLSGTKGEVEIQLRDGGVFTLFYRAFEVASYPSLKQAQAHGEALAEGLREMGMFPDEESEDE